MYLLQSGFKSWCTVECINQIPFPKFLLFVPENASVKALWLIRHQGLRWHIHVAILTTQKHQGTKLNGKLTSGSIRFRLVSIFSNIDNCLELNRAASQLTIRLSLEVAPNKLEWKR